MRIVMGSELSDQLRNIDWDNVIPRLARYVRFRSTLYPLPGGTTWEDIVQEAVKRFFSSRRWQADKVDALKQLKGIAASILSSHGWYERKSDLPLDNVDDGVAAEEIVDMSPEAFSTLDVKAAWKALEAEVGDDKELQDVLAAIQLHQSKPADVAKYTGYDVKRVYELQRKLLEYAHRASPRLEPPAKKETPP